MKVGDGLKLHMSVKAYSVSTLDSQWHTLRTELGRTLIFTAHTNSGP